MSAKFPIASAGSPLPAPHLLIAFAACAAEDWLPAMKALAPQGLPCLSRLLQGMTRVHSDDADSHTLSPPHERALARALGWNTGSARDGLLPWAALDAAQHLQAAPGSAWAWITPCHWAMGREHATLTDPAALALSESESRALLAAMQPYFATEGITLHYAEALGPGRWLASGEVFRHQPSASLDRVLGRNVDPWLPKPVGDTGSAARKIKLLQNEMQMLLYTHPLNEARAAQGRVAINSFWLSGTGALPAGTSQMPSTTVQRSLAPAVFSDDWAAYARAWTALDASDISALMSHQRAGHRVTLTLCGERNAHTFETRQDGWLARTVGRFTSPPLLNLLESL
ncbi:hypothetical protein [Polaromonas sp. YR568]|uniref:hypothetical protein n=1 Tax=Polaromonas sp. YR568 TaxID=1855301 RepID=UPI003137C379